MIPKFRIFDKKKKRFLDDFAMEIDRYGVHVLDEFNYVVDEDDRVLMQSTGLYDANGKEIYEGDIINCRDLWLDGDRRKTHKQIVKYDSGMFSAGYVSLRTNNSTSEVIGNIYENPELLEENK